MDPNDLSITAPDYSYFTALDYFLDTKTWAAEASEEVRCKPKDN